MKQFCKYGHDTYLTGRYGKACKLCAKQYHREYAQFNRDILREEKERACVDCRKLYPFYVMDFDHLYDKSFSIGKDAHKHSAIDLQKEIDKCVVVCANCHRSRTYRRSHPEEFSKAA